MNQYIELHLEEFDLVLEFLKEKFAGIRTGRASTDLLEGILIESYGTKSPINQLANIAIPDAKTITINPWDKSVLKEIEKALELALPNINPSNEGDIIRITLPALTEDNRKDLVKLVKQRSEDARIRIRNVRDEIKEEIIKAESANEVTEDERFRFIKELDDITQKYNEKVKELSEKKEKDIMTI